MCLELRTERCRQEVGFLSDLPPRLRRALPSAGASCLHRARPNPEEEQKTWPDQDDGAREARHAAPPSLGYGGKGVHILHIVTLCLQAAGLPASSLSTQDIQGVTEPSAQAVGSPWCTNWCVQHLHDTATWVSSPSPASSHLWRITDGCTLPTAPPVKGEASSHRPRTWAGLIAGMDRM